MDGCCRAREKSTNLQVDEEGVVEGGAEEDDGQGDQLLPQAERLHLGRRLHQAGRPGMRHLTHPIHLGSSG